MSILDHLRPTGAHRFPASRTELRAEVEQLQCDLEEAREREAALSRDLEEARAALGHAQAQIAALQQAAAEVANANSIHVPAPCDLRVPIQQATAPPPSPPMETEERFTPPAYVVALRHSPQAATPTRIPSWAETMELPVVQQDDDGEQR